MTHSNVSPDYVYKQGDDRPALTSTLHDADGNAVDLSDAQSVVVVLQAKDEFEADSDTLALNETASITDAANGVVEYQFQDGDLDIEPGRYLGGWRVSWPDAGGDGVADDQWFPRDGLLQVDVERTPTGSVDPADAPADLTVTRLTASEIAGGVAGGNVISNLAGANLSVDADGNLDASVAVTNDGSTVGQAKTVDAGSNLSASQSGETVTLDSTAGGAFEDTDSDGVAELQADAADYQGRPARNLSRATYSTTEVTASESPYLTQGEGVLYVDSSTGSVTVTLASTDATDGAQVEIYDVGESAGANPITVETEGSESIHPGGQSSISVSVSGAALELVNRSGSWFANRNAEFDTADATTIRTDELSGTVEVGDGDSIQDAINNATGPVEIKVRPDWDPSVETYPITIYTGDSPPSIVGPGFTARDPKKNASSPPFFDLGGVSAPMFELIGEESDGTEHNWAPNASIERFAVTGADSLLTIEDVDSSVFRDLYAYGLTDDAYVIKQSDTSNIWNRFINLHGIECSGAGFRCEGGAKANDTQLRDCVFRENGESGFYWASGVQMNFIGGTIERNDGTYQAELRGSEGLFFGVYTEQADSTATVIVRGSGCDNNRILANRFFGSNSERGVLINSGDSDRNVVDYNTYQGFDGGFVQFGQGEDNILGQHNVAKDSSSLLRSDSATRTRYGNTIGGGPLGGVDLSTTTGQYLGDRAVADGTSTAAAGALARWEGSAWQYHDPSGTV